jgi:hypothetical protein
VAQSLILSTNLGLLKSLIIGTVQTVLSSATTIGKSVKESRRYTVNRHADPITIDHIIALRKRVAELERQLENATAYIVPLKRENNRLKEDIESILKSMAKPSFQIKSVGFGGTVSK